MTSFEPSRSQRPIALGIDVGGREKGFHVVALDRDRQVTGTPERAHDVGYILEIIHEIEPRIVAIDAPCGWSQDRSRLAERLLARRGIRSFCTPSRERARANLQFYGWMFQGELVFKTVAEQMTLFEGGSTVDGTVCEVFPNATAHVLKNGPKPPGVAKTVWRRSLLRELEIDDSRFSNLDYVDAALCAVTGLFALRGDFEYVGQPGEGGLVIPELKQGK